MLNRIKVPFNVVYFQKKKKFIIKLGDDKIFYNTLSNITHFTL